MIGSPPSISHEVWPFGKGPITPGIGDFLVGGEVQRNMLVDPTLMLVGRGRGDVFGVSLGRVTSRNARDS